MQDLKVWGILNITPDSFSDGGLLSATQEYILGKVSHMIDSGADVIDIGAESTRPGAQAISSSQEWERIGEILPLVSSLARSRAVQISLDSYHADNVEKALPYIDIINDVSGFVCPKMLGLLKSSGLTAVLMHNLGVPAKRSVTINEGVDVVSAVYEWFDSKIADLVDFGISANQLILDPGIGFGKTQKQSMDLVRQVDKFNDFDLPVLMGHSRKGFLRQGSAPCETVDLDWSTAMLTSYFSSKSTRHVRVHNVAFNKGLLKFYTFLKNDYPSYNNCFLSHVESYFDLKE